MPTSPSNPSRSRPSNPTRTSLLLGPVLTGAGPFLLMGSPMPSVSADLARRLAGDAEGVCRYYLSNGRRAGRYWLVGDTANSKGRSLYVRLQARSLGNGAIGKWRDAATGEHGDLLDLIAANRCVNRLADAIEEARAYLRLPRPEPIKPEPPAPTGSPEAAARLWASAKPVLHTVADAYLRQRTITASLIDAPLRFHPRCYHQSDDGERTTWPALLAAVTDWDGLLTGVHRTWLSLTGGKAPVETPRRAMGCLLGNGVRFGRATDVAVVGEGIETMLSIRSALPDLPAIAALSAGHLGAIDFWPNLRRLYIAIDNDAAGRSAMERLTIRADAAGIEAISLTPTLGDFNDDLRAFGVDDLRAALRPQLAPDDAKRWAALD
jgi:hypothetical protein